jgi:ADP-ribose pyrophosphatase
MTAKDPTLPVETLFEGRFLSVSRKGGWEYVRRRNTSGIVCIVAVTPEAEMLFVEQYRPPVGARVIELPAGLAGDIAGAEDEPLSAAALRELEEETGWSADEMRFLTEGPVSAGLSTEVLSFFQAHGLRRVGEGGGDGSEDIVIHAVPVAEVPTWLAGRAAAGVMVDPKVYTGLYFAVTAAC